MSVSYFSSRNVDQSASLTIKKLHFLFWWKKNQSSYSSCTSGNRSCWNVSPSRYWRYCFSFMQAWYVVFWSLNIEITYIFLVCHICAIFLVYPKYAAIEKTLSQKLDDARQFVQLKIVKALKEYRNLYVVQHRLGGRLIFPESLTFLLLYGLALCKSLSLRGGYADALLDERCAAGFTLMILSTKRMTKLLYPSLMKIDEIILEVV